MLEASRGGPAMAANNALPITNQCVAQAMLGQLADARALRSQLDAQSEGGVAAAGFADCASTIAQQEGNAAALRVLADKLARAFPGEGAIDAVTVAFVYQQAGAPEAALAWYRRALDRREWILPQTPYIDPRRLTPAARAFFDTPGWNALWSDPKIQEWVSVRKELAAAPAP